MRITQIRNATQVFTYAGKKFLIDPVLAKKGAYPGFPGTARSEIRNPTVELPFDVSDIVAVDAVIVTHTHLDHWDDAAVQYIPKDMHIFVQNESDRNILQTQGFTNLTILSDATKLNDISIIKTKCQHGSDEAYADAELSQLLGEASGVVLQHPSEETVYFPGDTIWCKEVVQAMRKYQPGIVIMNLGYAHVLGFGSIIFGKEDVLRTHFLLPNAKIVATHMEAINHCLLTRDELKAYVIDNEIQAYVSIPKDGESLSFASTKSPLGSTVTPAQSTAVAVESY